MTYDEDTGQVIFDDYLELRSNRDTLDINESTNLVACTPVDRFCSASRKSTLLDHSIFSSYKQFDRGRFSLKQRTCRPVVYSFLSRAPTKFEQI